MLKQIDDFCLQFMLEPETNINSREKNRPTRKIVCFVMAETK